MPRNKKRINKLTTTYQAVCRKGDFAGPERVQDTTAYTDALGHNQEPGCANHIVSVNLIIRQPMRTYTAGKRRID